MDNDSNHIATEYIFILIHIRLNNPLNTIIKPLLLLRERNTTILVWAHQHYSNPPRLDKWPIHNNQISCFHLNALILWHTVFSVHQLVDAMNVVVVVTRWYGGIHLGNDRFRHINNATKELLTKHGFSKQKDTTSKVCRLRKCVMKFVFPVCHQVAGEWFEIYDLI